MHGNFILNFRRIFLYACVCLALVWGCDNKSEPPQKSKVVRKKIQIEAGEAGKKEDKVARSSSHSRPEDVGKGSPESSLEQYRKSSESDESVVSGAKTGETESMKLPGAVPSIDYNNILAKRMAAREGPPMYNPEGKIDPFMPLFKEEVPKEEVAVKEPKKKKRIPRTPLERIDISQLELVGIVKATGNEKAVVEESSGKGYIVTKGTYMGRNGGRVTDILNDRIIVEEEVVDVLGKSKIKKKVLKLQKPFGEN